jgi:hypothetical protein
MSITFKCTDRLSKVKTYEVQLEGKSTNKSAYNEDLLAKLKSFQTHTNSLMTESVEAEKGLSCNSETKNKTKDQVQEDEEQEDEEDDESSQEENDPKPVSKTKSFDDGRENEPNKKLCVSSDK